MQVPAPFEYERATTVDHAIALLERGGSDARVIAGGHSLLPMMKLRLERPGFHVDINDLNELDYITRDGSVLRIGALTRHRALLESSLVASLFPIITELAYRIVWVNPRKALPGYAPLAAGMAAALPHCDVFVSGHSLAALQEVVAAIGERRRPADEIHTNTTHNTMAGGSHTPVEETT